MTVAHSRRAEAATVLLLDGKPHQTETAAVMARSFVEKRVFRESKKPPA